MHSLGNMNSSTENGINSDIGGYVYAIGMSVGVLVVIILITLTAYFCTRGAQEYPATRILTNRGGGSISVHDSISVLELGLDEATLESYPKLLYSQAKLQQQQGSDGSSACSCPICLGDYKDSDLLRLLPDCGHLFHLQCADRWLRLNPTCPVCRHLPLPTPLSTPLAEVAPLAASRY